MVRELTCIVCPLGCQLKVEIEEGKVLSVTGNTCFRGEKYAFEECIHPMRTITTTVRCQGGKILPVKTDRTIPKEKMFEAIKIINATTPSLPISVGDVIIENVFGARVVATKDLR